MFVIGVYDIGEKRVTKVKKLFDQFLFWTQNSVFEGELSKAQLAELKMRLEKIIDKRYDSIIFYIVGNKKWVTRDVVGVDRGNIGNIL
mgnify:FL=1